MPRILQLSRQLDERPTRGLVEGIAVRNYGLSGDVDRWLAIRAATFEQELPGARVWGPHDFEREFLQKPLRNAEHLRLGRTSTMVRRAACSGPMAIPEFRASPLTTLESYGIVPVERPPRAIELEPVAATGMGTFCRR